MNKKPDFESLVNAAGDLMYTLDLEGRFTFVNKSGCELLGYRLNQLTGRHFVDILAPECVQVATTHFVAGLEGRADDPFFEVQVRTASGLKVELEVRAANLIHRGRVVGRQGTARDIGELKRLKAQVNEATLRFNQLQDEAQFGRWLFTQFGRFNEQVQMEFSRVQAGRSVGAVRSPGNFDIQEQDLVLLRALAAGANNREIANILHKSEHTVKLRISKLSERLGAENRTNLVQKAHSWGLL